jgi:hypothetical protein
VALSRALRLYWHATGRVRKQEDNRWKVGKLLPGLEKYLTPGLKITSTGLPIPLGICVQPQALDLDRVVIQDHLQPYLLEATQNPYDDMDAPLLLIKVCLLQDCTTLGISWHHTLGNVLSNIPQRHTKKICFYCKRGCCCSTWLYPCTLCVLSGFTCTCEQHPQFH